MSGIAGIIHFNGAPVAPGLVERMTAAMDYRGPDGICHWIRGSVALGQCMLRTTPESLEERQPLANEDESLVLVMDGRVDNWRELRRELRGRGAVLRDCSDAELVLRAYEAWGRECLAHIDGDFALVVWDARRREAFFARDRIGNRPLYFWHDSQGLAFASDFHALLKLPGSPREINEGMIAEHLAIRVDNLRETLICGIMRLPPAHFRVVSVRSVEERRYWDIDCHARITYRSKHEYSEHFRDLFRQTIDRQLRSIGPVGSYLSGGIDSSSVACVAAGFVRPATGLETFSLVFPGQDCDESAYIEEVNRTFGFGGHCVSGKALPFDHHVEQITRFSDVCDGPNGAMLNPLRSLARERGIRVMLTGYGGDEWFGRSGFYYAQILKSGNLSTLALQLAFDIANRGSGPSVYDALVNRGLRPLIPENLRVPVRRARQWVTRGFRKSAVGSGGILHPDLAMRVSMAERLAQRERCRPGVDPAHRGTHRLLPLGWNVRGSEIGNRGIASLGLEERNPFHDRRMIEFAFALPEDQRSRNAGKYVIRESLREVLPETIRTRRDKAEFSGVLADTLIMQEVCEWLPFPRLVERGWVDRVEVQRKHKMFCALYKDSSPAYIDHIWSLWMALALEVWLSAIGEAAA